ncbi:hypothetical protein M6B38_202740 [Iris pallida]|uniref:Uncharacterized protein n=1 Tax=Iris pallida TaxID=29817 RepID=A0AAX6E856_IRIPA|nr:hypothetical protein M6B38_202740 [Iris pallida]
MAWLSTRHPSGASPTLSTRSFPRERHLPRAYCPPPSRSSLCTSNSNLNSIYTLPLRLALIGADPLAIALGECYSDPILAALPHLLLTHDTSQRHSPSWRDQRLALCHYPPRLTFWLRPLSSVGAASCEPLPGGARASAPSSGMRTSVPSPALAFGMRSHALHLIGAAALFPACTVSSMVPPALAHPLAPFSGQDSFPAPSADLPIKPHTCRFVSSQAPSSVLPPF